MAYFARKLQYGAHDGEESASYMALLELAKKKGGRSIGFVLYRRVIQYRFPNEDRTEMVRLNAETVEEAIKRFWPLGEGIGKEFPGERSDRWEKTTLWIDRVAVGGSYEQFRPGTWVRVGTPVSWLRRRGKKRSLRFGNLGHILLSHQLQLRALKEEKARIEYEFMCSLSNLEGYDIEECCNYVPKENEAAYARTQAVSQENIRRITEEIDSVLSVIDITEAEMRYQAYRMFPKPMGRTPRRLSRI